MILYNISIGLYTSAIKVASLFNSKARLWVKGRKNWEKKLEDVFKKSDRVYWFHCASLGEFEQGRPLIEAIKKDDGQIKILLTFFSPSGYEVRKNYAGADHVIYLPADTRRNARSFISMVSPEKVFFIKYEFWYNYLRVLQKEGVSHYLVSGIFRPGQLFFGWYGRVFRKVLAGFTHLFVQDKASEELLKIKGINNVTVNGDTRFDRVYDISRNSSEIDIIKQFSQGSKVIIAGSSWPAEEEMICRYINERDDNNKWIIAPHETGEQHIEQIEKQLAVSSARYTQAGIKGTAGGRVLIIDIVGILSSVYRYGDIAVIGGGFGKGIHNILEPATWGMPVLFGPNNHKFREAAALIEEGGAFTFRSYKEFSNNLDALLRDEVLLDVSSKASVKYVEKNLGATEIVLKQV